MQRQVVADMFGSNTLSDNIRKILAISTAIAAVIACFLVPDKFKGSVDQDATDYI